MTVYKNVTVAPLLLTSCWQSERLFNFITLLFNLITVTSISLISMGSSSVQRLKVSCVMHVWLISLWGSLCHEEQHFVLIAAFYLHTFEIQRGLLALLLQLKKKHTLWNEHLNILLNQKREMDIWITDSYKHWRNDYRNTMQLPLTWHSAWEQVGFYSPK